MTTLAGSPTDPLGCFATADRECRQATFTVELGGVDTHDQLTLSSGRSHAGCRVSEHDTAEGSEGTTHSTGTCARAVLVPSGLQLQACGTDPDWTIDRPVASAGRA